MPSPQILHVSQKIFNTTVKHLKSQTIRVDWAERRVAEVEEDVLLQAIQAQENIQTKLTELKARSRRNNIIIKYIIKWEFSLRCHRARGPKPPQKPGPTQQ